MRAFSSSQGKFKSTDYYSQHHDFLFFFSFSYKDGSTIFRLSMRVSELQMLVTTQIFQETMLATQGERKHSYIAICYRAVCVCVCVTHDVLAAYTYFAIEN